jgi:hypothetical protein
VLIVMPRWRSSGALSISAKLLTCPPPPFLWRTDRADVEVRLRALELLLGHIPFFL